MPYFLANSCSIYGLSRHITVQPCDRTQYQFNPSTAFIPNPHNIEVAQRQQAEAAQGKAFDSAQTMCMP